MDSPGSLPPMRHWLAASDDSALAWPFVCPMDCSASVCIVAAVNGDSAAPFAILDVYADEATPNGSYVHLGVSSVTLHLTQQDKVALEGKPASCCLHIITPAETYAADLCELIVSDWAAEPCGGTA